MKKFLSILALALVASVSAAISPVHANELDNEDQVKNAQRFAADLPQTVVVKKSADGTVSVLQSKELIQAGVKLPATAQFAAIDASGNVRKELDGDSSTGNWFFYFNNFNNFNYGYNYFYPTYNYFGYNYFYQPYYNYSWNNSWYSYYRWF
jgi:hypothetical protein